MGLYKLDAMSKELPYFQFEPAEYIASDISMCTLAAQGLFINIQAIYWQKDCILKLSQIEKRFNEPELLEELLLEKVIKVKGDLITINFLEQQHEALLKRKNRLSNAGKKGAKQRVENQVVNKGGLSEDSIKDEATLKQPEEKRREENILSIILPADESAENNPSSKKEKEETKSLPGEIFNWDGLIKKINKETGRSFKLINPTIRRKYLARIKDGYTKEDINKAIENAPKSEAHKENNCQYLTPEFFARAETIDKYSAVTTDNKQVKAPKMN